MAKKPTRVMTMKRLTKRRSLRCRCDDVLLAGRGMSRATAALLGVRQDDPDGVFEAMPRHLRPQDVRIGGFYWTKQTDEELAELLKAVDGD